MNKKERGLGKGLEALLSASESESVQVMELETNRIIPQKNQPRKVFEPESLQELAASIKEHGVLQPVLVRPVGDYYEIIAGERRYRAAEMAGLQVIPALIKDMKDIEAAEISLVENLQREDLSPIEEANAYKNLIEKYKYSQELIAERVGKSRAYVTNTLRLLKLDPKIIQMIEKKQITAGHARALLAIKSAREQVAAAKEIIKAGMSVRETEQKMKLKGGRKKATDPKNPELLDVEDRLQRYFGTRIEITQLQRGGKIEISYYNDDDLERILEMLEI